MAKYLDLDGLTRYNNKVNAKLDEKANVDGAYELMTVGNAEQLIASTTVEDKSPYLFRTSGGSLDIGDRLNLKSIVGCTVVWNQIVSSYQVSAETYGITREKVSTDLAGGLRIYGTSEISTAFTSFYILSSALSSNHKYYITLGNVTLPSGARLKTDVSTADKQTETIGTLSDTSVGIYIVSGTVIDVTIKPQVFDLTAMLGSNIADYIYSLEQATAGSGVAYFRSLFPKNYYAYNAGQLMSVKALSHKMVGFNQWDEEWESGSYNSNGVKVNDSNRIRSKNLISVLPNTTYYKKSGSAQFNVYFYDANKDFISYSNYQTTFTTPQNCYYINFSYGSSTNPQTTYNNDICINFHWDGSRDGEYEPYKKNSYDLSGSHEVTRKWGVISYNGSENWTLNATGYGRFYLAELPSGIDTTKKTTSFAYGRTYYDQSSAYGDYFAFGGSGIYCNRIDTNDTVEAFKQRLANNNLYILYPIQEYTETVTNPTLRGIPKLDANNNLYYDGDSFSDFQNLQIVDDFGTEEFVDNRDVPIPVGHLTDYYPDLRAKLEMTPNSPDGNGDYIVRQTNGVNEYVEYVSPIPTPPTTDGNYALKATVSSGVATFSWVEE